MISGVLLLLHNNVILFSTSVSNIFSHLVSLVLLVLSANICSFMIA